MKLTLSKNFFISDIGSQDKEAFVKHLSDKEIYDHTLAIPYPYMASDATHWILTVAEQTQKQGHSVNWAIRRQDGHLIGGIGFHDLEVGKSHKAELGYWLAKPYWNQGIMTEAVKKVTEFGFKEFKLARIYASVFHFNKGSARVLEKAGFQFEGDLQKYYKKEGKIFDGKLYAKVT